jgi:phage shock protein A
MALINRMSRLLTADVHAVLDRLEEPEALLKQAIREMEEELARAERQVRTLENESATLGDRRGAVRALLAELEDQLDVCFANGNDELARKVLRRRLENERLDNHIAQRQAAVEADLDRQRTTARDQAEQLDVMRQKADLFARHPRGRERAGSEFAVGDAEVEVAFLRERHKRQGP